LHFHGNQNSLLMSHAFDKSRYYLGTPASPHIIISPNGLAVTHETKVHCRANQFPVKSKVHSTHWEQGAFWDCQNSIHIPVWAKFRIQLDKHWAKSTLLLIFWTKTKQCKQDWIQFTSKTNHSQDQEAVSNMLLLLMQS